MPVCGGSMPLSRQSQRTPRGSFLAPEPRAELPSPPHSAVPDRAAAPSCTPRRCHGAIPAQSLALPPIGALAHRSGYGAKSPLVNAHNANRERAAPHSPSPPTAGCPTIPDRRPLAVLPTFGPPPYLCSAAERRRRRGNAMRKLVRRLVCISCGGIALITLEAARLAVACRRRGNRRAQRQPTWV